ncbi:MAG: thymidine phosphorylase [Clostridiaceae bacterium]|jgi:pyrimidine-nucleoside phosphorylase|nr:thymidine phosphorylase [Clostridiaceae bacterium]
MRYSAFEIIDKKRRAEELTDEEIRFFVAGSVAGTIPDYQISAWLMTVAINGMSFEETLALTLAMRDSGKTVKLSGGVYADKHSTGGVGDSATFVVLPAVTAAGCKILKMSGRGLGHTGGTLDKLETVKGFNIELTETQIKNQLKTVGAALIGQSEDIAPADKIFYALRDVTATVDSLPLIASSIMSKKLATGADVIVIDVKCGNGSFNQTREKAAKLSDLLVRIGSAAGKKVGAVITDMNQPLDAYVGNALEILGAVKALKGERGALYDVSRALSAEILYRADKADSLNAASELFDEVIASGAALNKFKEILAAQGGDASLLDDEKNFLTAKYRRNVYADNAGTVTEMDTKRLGNALVRLGGGRLKKDDLIDVSAGFKMGVRLGDKIKKGGIIAEMFYNSTAQECVANEIKTAVRIV